MWSEQLDQCVERRRRRASQQGFTLVELMTVVIIVGVLSAVAVPTFTSYIYKSRTSEATEFLGIIRLREESYRSEFGQYCPTLPIGSTPTSVDSLKEPSNLVPDPTTTRRDAKAFSTTATEWQQLGARPTSNVRYGYGVAAGAPDSAPSTLGWNSTNADFWFVARAVGDLDADGTYGTFEIYSASKNVFFQGPDGKAIAKGWE